MVGASAVPDVLGPGVRVVFCGINPGRVSAAAGAPFANPRNDFWRLLHAAGFTPGLLQPEEAHELLRYGVGLTNAARRTTKGSGDLRKADFAGAASGSRRSPARCVQWRSGSSGRSPTPGVRRARRARASGAQLGETALFVLPSTSPANAAVPWDERLRWFRALRELVA